MDETVPPQPAIASDDVAEASASAVDDVAGASSPAVDRVADGIIMIRGRRAMLDVDLAMLYGVTPRRLNEQVKRNQARFPDDLCFS